MPIMCNICELFDHWSSCTLIIYIIITLAIDPWLLAVELDSRFSPQISCGEDSHQCGYLDNYTRSFD